MPYRHHPPHFPPPLAPFDGQPPPAPDWFSQALADAPERSEVRVQGTPVETLAWGRRGDPGLLLLHGNGAHADWYSFIGPLLKPGRRVVAISFSGAGGSGWRTQYSVAQWADEALAAAEATGLYEAPRAARARACARPRPPPAPVTMATRPVKSRVMRELAFWWLRYGRSPRLYRKYQWPDVPALGKIGMQAHHNQEPP